MNQVRSFSDTRDSLYGSLHLPIREEVLPLLGRAHHGRATSGVSFEGGKECTVFEKHAGATRTARKTAVEERQLPELVLLHSAPSWSARSDCYDYQNMLVVADEAAGRQLHSNRCIYVQKGRKL